MGNARDAISCSKVVIDQVSSVAMVAVTVATIGSASAAVMGERAAATGARVGADATKAAEAASKSRQAFKVLKEALGTAKDAKVIKLQDIKLVANAVKGCVQAGLTEGELANNQLVDDQGAAVVGTTSCLAQGASVGQAWTQREAALIGQGSNFFVSKAQATPLKVLGVSSTAHALIVDELH
jgi:hypothetical protein